MKLAKRIKDTRLEKRWTQAKLTKLCGWTEVARISNYERGVRSPNIKDAKIIAKALEVKPAWLLFGTLPKTANTRKQKKQDFTAENDGKLIYLKNK